MNNKTKIIISVAVAVVVLASFAYLYFSGTYKDYLAYKGQQGEETSIKTPDGKEIKGIVVSQGTSLIDEKGTVLNKNTGAPVKNDAESGRPEAPQQSNPTSKEALPASVIKISASANGFTPKSFQVSPGAPVSLSVTSEDDRTYVFAFRDPSLSGIALGVGPLDKTRVISFNAPSTAGTYIFFSNMPSQSQLPAFQGEMIVK